MERKRRTLDQLSDAGQDVMSLLRNAEAGSKIEGDTEELAQRWDNLVQRLEDYSYKVCVCVCMVPELSVLTNHVIVAHTCAHAHVFS